MTSECTIGSIYIDDTFYGFTLEDIFHEYKQYGKTRIPCGNYEIRYKKVLTNLTKKYRRKFKWFKWHLELQNVPNYSAVYIHIGNTARDTRGCILVGLGHIHGSSSISSSTTAYKNIYKIISKSLNDNNNVYITVDDEEYLSTPSDILNINNDGILDITDYQLLSEEFTSDGLY
jgi:hypothetical protein